MGERFIGSLGALKGPVPSNAWQMPKAVAGLPPEAFAPLTYVRDQLNLGACTGFAFATVGAILSNIPLVPSPLALYYFNRKVSGFPTTSDSGAYPEQSAIAMREYGMGSESLWHYDVKRFAQKPDASYMLQAADHRITHYYRARTIDQVKTALAGGLGVVGSFDVPRSFDETGESGVWVDAGGPDAGGHAVAIVGYDDQHLGGSLLVQNSWGSRWGTWHPARPQEGLGYFWLPYDAFEYGPRWFDGIVLTKMDLA